MMKLALTLEADSVNVQALNMGRIVVDVDGIELAELINMVCDNGYSLRVVDESDQTSAECTPPFATLTGIRCSTAHITETDNAWLYSLSHQTSDFGESEWIHFTGSGYLLRTDAWSYPVLRLKRLGLSKTFRRLVVTLIRRYGPDEQRISFWPQHFGLIPQWVTLEPRVFGWMDRLCEDYCGGILALRNAMARIK
ncbi:hypothetical protein WEY_02758, partial [Escherichia coli KTE34]